MKEKKLLLSSLMLLLFLWQNLVYAFQAETNTRKKNIDKGLPLTFDRTKDISANEGTWLSLNISSIRSQIVCDFLGYLSFMAKGLGTTCDPQISATGVITYEDMRRSSDLSSPGIFWKGKESANFLGIKK